MLKSIIVGNLGGDPEMRYTQDGKPLLRFSVAANYRVKDADGGGWSDAVQWVRCTVFGNRAETLGQYLKKGMKVFVSGRLEARPWIDSNNQPQAGLEVLVDDVEFMSRQQDEGSGYPSRGPASAANVARQADRQARPPADLDDDLELPF
jgi:single-strand DNA-binding protein